MAVIIPVASKFDDSGIKSAKKAFGGLSSTLKSTIGTLGVTLGVAALTRQLMDASKAAVEDTKSQALLANQLMNSVGATNDQITAVEASISAMQLQASVADDVIRPAFAQLARATGDVTKATELTQLALDVSAGTGRDLGAVSIALSRAYAGNTASLSRLGIKAQEGVDIFDQLREQFSGSAEAAAQNDPYQRLNIIFGEIQEQIGMALLPKLNEMADFFASPAGQKELAAYANLVKELAGVFIFVGTTVAEFLAGFRVVGTAFGKLFKGDFAGFIELMNSRGMVDALAKLDGIGTSAAKTANARIIAPGVSVAGGTSRSTSSAASTKKTKAEIAAEKADKAYKKALADLVNFQDELRGMADFTSLTKMSEELGQFEQSVTDSFDEIYKKLADAPKGTNLTKLKAFLDAEKALLVKNAKDRDAIVKKRQDVEALLTDIKSSISGMGKLANLLDNSTRTITKTISKIVNGFKVATTTTIEEALGAKGYQKRLEDILLATKNFATQLTQLKAAGLTADLFLEIAQAGPEVGGQLAAEILAGGADAISALNTTYGDLQAVSSAIAEQTAAVLYNNGVEVAGGLVKGLLAEEQKLVDAGKTLADQFNTGYTEQLAGLTVPGGPTITPKTQPKATVIKPTINIKATPNTKADAQRIVAAVNKYATASGYGLLNAKML